MANFIDAEAVTSKLHDRRVLKPGEVGPRGYILSRPNSLFWKQLGLGDCGNAPGEVELGGLPRDIHDKGDTLGVIKGYQARLAAIDILVGAVPRLASV